MKSSRWIRSYLSSILAVIVNDEPKGRFKASRGLRQADSLSPFLFTLVVDVSSRMISKVAAVKVVIDFEVGRDGMKLSHLQFANDTILFSGDDKDNFMNFGMLVRRFDLVSCLKRYRAKVSHLHFLNDTILFTGGDEVKFMNWVTLLRCFELVSDLEVNMPKSSIGSINGKVIKIKRFVST